MLILIHFFPIIIQGGFISISFHFPDTTIVFKDAIRRLLRPLSSAALNPPG